jgi:enoyl-CoA hydratase
VSAADFEATVSSWAGRVAAKSPLLMRLGKNALDATRDLALSEALAHLQAQLALAFTTSDIKEGVAAFREKRDPQWHMR